MGAFKTKVIKLLADAQKTHAIAMLNNVPTGVNLEMVIREATKKRNNDQNALMWSVLGEIAEQVWIDKRQYSADMWNVYFKNVFLPDEATEPYIHELVNKPESYRKWSFIPDGTRQLTGSTTDLTTYGMSQYTEKVYAFASENGVMFEVAV